MNWEKITPDEMDKSPFKLMSKEWMLVTSGTQDDFNTMTASWGALGYLWNRPVAFVFIRPQRYTYEFAEKNETMTLSFFGSGYRKELALLGSKSGRDGDKVAEAGITAVATDNGNVTFAEAKMCIEGIKLYSSFMEKSSFMEDLIPMEVYPDGDFHKMYIIEITGIFINKDS